MLLYHEQQVAALCGQHCLNNLLQGPYFTEWDLADIAQELDRKEKALMLEAGMTTEAAAFMAQQGSGGTGNVDLDGNFSVQVLTAALQRAHSLSLEDSRRPENRNAMVRPETQEGFVLNRSAHWYCLRQLDGQWWQMNSALPAPEKISNSTLAATLAELAANKWTIFLVTGGKKLPAPMLRSSGAAPASHWVDPAQAASGGGSVVGAKAEPTFEAFTGSGQTLGGATTGEKRPLPQAAGSEDEQLARALALSSGLALKERLEKRLPAEPEAGAPAARIQVVLPDGGRATRRFPAVAPLQAALDFVCVQLASGGIAPGSGNWVLASRALPGSPAMKLAFAADATAADATLAARSFNCAGLAPSAQLHLTAA